MRSVLFVLAMLFAAGCTGTVEPPDIPAEAPGDTGPRGSVFGDDGLSLNLFGNATAGVGTGEPGIGVNSFLWRASLDTVSFLPITAADPFGGVILTDWYTPPGTLDERLKLNVYILDRQLRADGIRVAVFRQERDENGAWLDAEVSTETATTIEDAILTRARELRIASAALN